MDKLQKNTVAKKKKASFKVNVQYGTIHKFPNYTKS